MKNVRGSSTCNFHHHRHRHKCSSSNDEGRAGKMATENTYTQLSSRKSEQVIIPGRDSNAAITIIYSLSASRRLTPMPSLSPLQQYFTKGHYNFFTSPPFKLVGQISTVFSVTKLSLSRLFALVALFL